MKILYPKITPAAIIVIAKKVLEKRQIISKELCSEIFFLNPFCKSENELIKKLGDNFKGLKATPKELRCKYFRVK